MRSKPNIGGPGGARDPPPRPPIGQISFIFMQQKSYQIVVLCPKFRDCPPSPILGVLDPPVQEYSLPPPLIRPVQVAFKWND